MNGALFRLRLFRGFCGLRGFRGLLELGGDTETRVEAKRAPTKPVVMGEVLHLSFGGGVSRDCEKDATGGLSSAVDGYGKSFLYTK